MIHKCRGRGKVREEEETLYILVIGNCICNCYVAYMGVCMCVSIYIYIYIHTHTHAHRIQCGNIIPSLNRGLLGYHIGLWKIRDFPYSFFFSQKFLCENEITSRYMLQLRVMDDS